ncbi:MAG: VWA domain-containing protein, partial [Candidatus Margulisbacteria bacterium]|nr:VWA domain-containing protein [Candidatus Margulisiibacteriota bacterium]
MTTKILVFLACSLFFLMGITYADGLIVVDPPFRSRQPITALTVKYHRVKVEIDNGVATTSIDQVFKNDYDVDVEGTYIFPLPEEAAITDFAMYVDGKRISGKVLDKDKARQVYEDIVSRMKDPGLLEYVGRNMFKARVYPIPANGEKRVQLVYKQTLKYDAGVYQYVYPLDTERFSPKPLEKVAISANIKSKTPIKSVYSPSHKVDASVKRYEASAGYEDKNVKPDKNFVLYYSVSEKDVGLNLFSYKKDGEDGYFMMLLSPGDIAGKTINKDIVFVLDTSGSMGGDKIKQAKEALEYCVTKLGRGDRFNIISFATDVKTYKDELVPGDLRNQKLAVNFIDNIEARGGTNINEALLAAVDSFEDSKRPRMLVFLTDGEPTVGETDMKAILKNLDKANKAEARIFVFGVGNDVNTHLLDKMAEEHRGVPEYVKPEENIEVNVSSFYRKISEPILSDIELDFGKIKAHDLQPRVLPDIFRGSQLALLGRFKNHGSTPITLTGYVNGEKKKFVYEAKFVQKDTDNDFIPRLWATRKIGELMAEARLNGEKKELIDEIIKLSKEHGIMTPYTSFLILEKEEDYDRWGIGAASAPKMEAEGKKYMSDMLSVSGAGSVSRSVDIKSLKESEVAEQPVLESVKHVGHKTFYL